MGNGHPVHRRGSDSGAFVALGEGGWVQRPPGYPATIHTTWSAATQIDGCIDESTAEARCVAVLLSDQVNGQGFFALVTARASGSGNYSLAQRGGAPILLAPLLPVRVSETGTTPTTTTATLHADTGTVGMYLDPDCPVHPFVGFRIYGQKVARNAAPPSDLRRDEAAGWTIAMGGEAPTGEPLTADDNPVVVTGACTPTEDMYLAMSLIFDSGFETQHLSEPWGPIQCGVPHE